MFGYLSGKIVDLTPTMTYIDVNGVGYEVQISLHTYEAINGKEQAKLYTHLQIREDAWVMYGFATMIEKETFQKLLSVSGVGSATARILLSSLTAVDFARIVINGDAKALEKVKGIGTKTAQRIILELKEKMPDNLLTSDLSPIIHNTNMNDALNALLGLGITKAMAESALKKTEKLVPTNATIEELIKTALKNL